MLIKALGNNILAFLKKHFLPYLVKQAPVEENGVTLVLDEGVDRQADRPYLWKRCLYLNGSSDYINFDYSITGDFTVTVWFKTVALPSSGAYTLFQSTNYSIRGQIHSDGYIYLDCGGNAIWTRFSSSDIKLGEWNAITFRYDTSETLFVDAARVFLNKEELISVSTSGTHTASTVTSIDVGRRTDGNTNYFLGHIKQFAVTNTALTEAQCLNHEAFGTEYLFEEGDGTTVYATDGTEGTITTSNINAVRVEQPDAPLLPLSGDIVGVSNYTYFDGTAKVEAASNTVQDETTGDFTLLAWVCLNDDSSDAAVDDDQGLIAKISIGPNVNGYTLYLASGKVRAEFVSSTTRFTTSIMTYDLNNNTNKWHLCAARFDRDGNLSATVVQPDGTIETQTIDISGENGNSITNTETFTLGNYFQFTDRDFFGFMSQAAKFSSLLTDAELTELHSQGKDYSFASDTGNYTSSANLTGHWIAPSNASSDWTDTQGNGDLSPTNLVKLAIPKGSGSTDLHSERLTHTGRKDWPLTPKNEPAWQTVSGDYATMDDYTLVAEEEYIIEVLQINYTDASTGTYLGNQASDNFIIGLNSDNWYVRLGSTAYSVSTGLDLSDISNFRVYYRLHNFGGTGSSITTFDIESYIYDLDGTELASDTSTGELASGTVLNMMFASLTSAPTRQATGVIPWIKFYVDGTLNNQWEYLGNNSLVIWERVAGNHATITTSDITANQGTQSVYSSRLKDGYSQEPTLVDSNVWSSNGILLGNRGHNLNGENWYFDQNHSGAGFANWNVTYENNYLNLAPDHVTTAIETFYLFLSGNVPTTYFIVGVRYKVTVTIYMPPSNNWDRAYFDVDADWSDHYRATTYFFPNSNEQTMEIEFVPGNSNITQNDVQIRVRCKSGYDPNVDLPMEIRNWKLEIMNEDVPANLLNNGLDIYGNTLTHPAGTYLHSDIKLTSPAFRTLDRALQSNEELYRDTTDSQGNTVYDRLLIPLSYGKSDKGFPAFNTNNGDYAMFTPINVRDGYVGGQTNRFEALIIDYNSSRMIMGNSANANRAFGFQFGDVIAWHNGSSIYQVNCGLGLASRTEPFIAVWEWTVESVSSAPQVTNIYLAIQDLQGNILFESNGLPSNNTATAFTYLDTIGNKGGTLGDPIDATIAYIKYYKNDVITHLWTYAGNNSLIIQELVGGNHGSITTADITLNQGEQDVFNPLVDGFSLGVDATYPTVKLLPQHPYNGLDIFDNTLTTPRTKERTKSLKYTDND